MVDGVSRGEWMRRCGWLVAHGFHARVRMESGIDGIEEDVVRVAGVLPEHDAAEVIVADVECLGARDCVFVVDPGLGAAIVEIGDGAVVPVAHEAGGEKIGRSG